MNKMKMTGAALAIGAAAVFSVAPTVASAHPYMVKCLTVNGCRGFSDCATAMNACKGQNACKGRGYVVLKRSQCAKILGPYAVDWK